MDTPPPKISDFQTWLRSHLWIDGGAIRWRTVLKHIALMLVITSVLIAALLTGLNTAPGRRFLVGFATGLKLPAGLQIEIGEIDGSIYGDMTLHDLKLKDPKGVFAQSPLVDLNWHPFGYLDGHVDIEDLSSPRVEILRNPQFAPEPATKTSGPTLPNLKIDIDRLSIQQIALDAPVLGEARTLSLNGSAHLLHGDAKIEATALSDKADIAILHLDAVPDANRLDINAQVKAPADGVIADMMGLKTSLAFSLTGAGDWNNWRGHTQALLGQESLADLDLAAAKGVFRIDGLARPDLLMHGDNALLAPGVRIDSPITAQDRDLSLKTTLTSNALAVTANGGVDLGASRFRNLQVQARLLRPDTLDKDLTAQDLHADLTVDGAFDAPRVDYTIAATRLAIGKIVLTGLAAKGKSHVDNGVFTIPLDVQLASLTGLGATVDPLLTHLRLAGNLREDGGRLSSDTLRLSSDRVKASGTVSGDAATGSYAAAVQAALNGFHLDKVGTLDLTSAARLTFRTGKGLALNGVLDAQSTRWDNDAVGKFLGGKAKLSGGYALSPDGAFSFSGLKGTAPQLQLLSGTGSFGHGGAVKIDLTAHSNAYGPLALAVTGTLEAPNAVLKAASPGLGLQISDVVANLSGTADGFAVTATGGSAYGPFDADTLLHTAHGPLVVDVKQAHFAGVALAGQLTATSAGPFTGALSLAGQGLTGTAQLMSINGVQGASLNATGNNVNLPGGLNVHIGRTIITATATLGKEADINADVQMADLSYGQLQLSTGRAKVQLTGDRGTVQAVLHGQGQVPFDLALNANVSPDAYVVAAQGKVQGVGFRFANPARVTRSGGDWVLAPLTINWDAGRMELAGRLGGKTLTAQARLEDVDLNLINLVQPDAGLSGKANGAVDFSTVDGGFPTARAQLTISNFSRASAAVVSTPVDLVVDAGLNPDESPGGNYAHALVREGGTVVGQIQIALRPAAAGTWIERVEHAGLSGGVRYNGPAGVPFSLTGLARQQLTGAVALAADLGGTVNSPLANGLVKATSLTYDNDTFGTRVSNIALDGTFNNDKLTLSHFSGKAGDGTVTATGWLGLQASQHFPMAVHAELTNARLAQSDAVDLTVTGTLDATSDGKNNAVISGDLKLPRLRYTISRQGAAEVTELEGVTRKGAPPVMATADSDLPNFWKLDIKARADNHIFISGLGLESEWSMRMHVTGTTLDPQVVGDMKVVRGTYSFSGRDFTLNTGTITFDGGHLTNPEINISASADVNDITGIINITGTAQQPQIAFSSTPALPQDEVLSRLLFGESVTNLSATDALQLAAAINGLRGDDSLNPLSKLRQATGIDRLRVISADAATGRGTALAAGKYITNNIYVEVVTDTKGFAATQIEVALSHALSILSQTGGVNGSSVNIKYSKDY